MMNRLVLGAVATTLLASSSLFAMGSDTTSPSVGRSGTHPKVGALDLPRHVIATGGGRSAGGAWVIRGTLAQVDAEPLQPSTDGSGFYAITGGFWPALPAPQIDWLFADGMEAQGE